MEDKRIRILKALAHSERLKIIEMLKKEPTCVCEMNEKSNFSQSNISQHLKILRDADLVKYTKDGNKVIYSLANEKLMEVINLITKISNEL
ncbi:transcriptional regulator [Tepiditoga spiralis]|uniref:Transcriptional regulator n=1 Tax=Tepiditoga spiralis TaxID=2108365 RepID=A0A7G1G3J8_9BACT|nr:metalloregulator ArsR/SmtB family transcription factor [Tepiditoga spiralis]BBE30595.1 transcriptional regulator [Tepiditoga spiralis]